MTKIDEQNEDFEAALSGKKKKPAGSPSPARPAKGGEVYPPLAKSKEQLENQRREVALIGGMLDLYKTLDKDLAEAVSMATEKVLKLKTQAACNFLKIGKIAMDTKDILSHGQFLAWVKQHIYFDERHVQRMMQVAKWVESLPEGEIRHRCQIWGLEKSRVILQLPANIQEKAFNGGIEDPETGEIIDVNKASVKALGALRKRLAPSKRTGRPKHPAKPIPFEKDPEYRVMRAAMDCNEALNNLLQLDLEEWEQLEFCLIFSDRIADYITAILKKHNFTSPDDGEDAMGENIISATVDVIHAEKKQASKIEHLAIKRGEKPMPLIADLKALRSQEYFQEIIDEARMLKPFIEEIKRKRGNELKGVDEIIGEARAQCANLQNMK